MFQAAEHGPVFINHLAGVLPPVGRFMWDVGLFIARFVYAHQQLGLAETLSPEARKASLCDFVHNQLFHILFLSSKMLGLFQKEKKPACQA